MPLVQILLTDYLDTFHDSLVFKFQARFEIRFCFIPQLAFKLLDMICTEHEDARLFLSYCLQFWRFLDEDSRKQYKKTSHPTDPYLAARQPIYQ